MKPTKPKRGKAIAEQSEKPVSTAPEREKDGVLVVAVRASTGGLKAFTELTHLLPDNHSVRVGAKKNLWTTQTWLYAHTGFFAAEEPNLDRVLAWEVCKCEVLS